MRQLSRRHVLAMLPTAALPLAASARDAWARPRRNTFAITDVRVFDGRRVIERGTVHVVGGRIAGVGRCRLPNGTHVYEGAGRTVLPGLIDSHVHSYDEAGRDALRFGVTTELDMFGDPSVLAEARRDRRSTRKLERADLWSAGIGVTVPGGHPRAQDIPRLTPDDDPYAFVAARVREGSDYIKVVLERRADFKTLTPEQAKAVVTAAHRHRRMAVAHAEWTGDASTALDVGVDGIVHAISDQQIDDTWVRQFRRNRTFMVPTLSVYDCGAGADSLMADERVAPYLSETQYDTLLQRNPRCNGGWLVDAQANVGKLHRAGVPIAAGTDALMPGTASGASMIAELALLVGAGLSPVEALAAGTSTPARLFGLGDRGRLALGRKADLLLVDGDPTRDIDDLRNVARIWKNGYQVDRTPPPPTED
ncbi:amidohydrolase family protein [Tenggerimyces flavus]|uniref:Amidohydrolase family protein n=1 Tax=Tenggerimyces flavus TaxID=1708749 RepID=A0ABV7YBD9_9ACTN|nr:amidohydrolase family protein [Tenggerimyces flavus]MBM7788924.1 imidazolonepropionase-like amidohydrolase [Tenggerimyces flavus]